jgi:MipA family protein
MFQEYALRLTPYVLASILAASPAIAQDAKPDPSRDTITVGVGAAAVPRYEGSDDYRIVPAGAIRGKVSGISFITLGTALFVDLIPSGDGPGTSFSFGPMAHLSLNRSGLKSIRDPQIAALGKIKPALEVGAHAGITRTGLITSDYDSLNIDVAVSHDVTGIHDSMIVTPSITYGTPLSRKVYVGLTASANHVGNGYGQTYFGVTPAQSIASGLPAYTPGSGFKDVSFGALGNLSLTGDLRRGLSLFAIGNYSKLLGDFGRSPVVREPNQWFGALGLAYTF